MVETVPQSQDDWHRWVQTHGPAWRLLAARWSDSPDDCVQQALLRLINQTPSPNDPVAWMFRVVRNLAIDSRRRTSRGREAIEHLASRQPAWTEVSPELGLELAELNAALHELADEEATIVMGRIWGQLTYAQLGEVLGCSPPTVMRRFQAALTQLGKRLEGSSHCSPPASRRSES